MSHFTVLVALEDVSESIDEIMEPFWEQTENPDYLEFIDAEEQHRTQYESKGINCVRMPNGTICLPYDPIFSKLYTVENGVVYKEEFGQLHHKKRTKKAKKIQFLPDYPYKKLYKSFVNFLEDYHGYQYNKTENRYGYYTNPNAFWDWYQIGGRWAYSFLVKENYKEPIKTELSWASDPNPPKAPKGYKWVSAAEKGAIEWALMKQLSVNEQTEMFHKYQKAFNTQSLEELEFPLYVITDQGIENLGTTVYYKDETLENFLARHNLSNKDEYGFIPYGFVNNGEYYSLGDMGWWGVSTNEKEEEKWNKEVNNFLDSLDDSQIIVLLDCHV